MKQIKLPAVFMRGGTSNAIVFHANDLPRDRALWDEYIKAYETALQRCSTKHAPWHIIPADRNWVRNAVIARIVRETLETMNPQFPEAKGWDPSMIKIV